MTATVSFSSQLSDDELANLDISMSSSSSAVQVSKASQLKFTLTANEAGSAEITCRISDPSGKYSFDSNSVTVTVTDQSSAASDES